MSLRVSEPRAGTWSDTRAYVDPEEYTYYTYMLFERRVADDVGRLVLCSMSCAEDSSTKRKRRVVRPTT